MENTDVSIHAAARAANGRRGKRMHVAAIGDVMVSATSRYMVYGESYGLMSGYRTLKRARDDLRYLQCLCRKYSPEVSDCAVYEWDGDKWLPRSSGEVEV